MPTSCCILLLMLWFSVKYSVVKLACLLLAGLDAVPPGSPMMMSAAQCVLLARSAARAERTEALKETKSLAKRKCIVVVLLFGFLDFFGGFFWFFFGCFYLLDVCMKCCCMLSFV